MLGAGERWLGVGLCLVPGGAQGWGCRALIKGLPRPPPSVSASIRWPLGPACHHPYCFFPLKSAERGLEGAGGGWCGSHLPSFYLLVISPASLGIFLHSNPIPSAAPVAPSFTVPPPLLCSAWGWGGWRVDVEGPGRTRPEFGSQPSRCSAAVQHEANFRNEDGWSGSGWAGVGTTLADDGHEASAGSCRLGSAWAAPMGEHRRCVGAGFAPVFL